MDRVRISVAALSVTIAGAVSASASAPAQSCVAVGRGPAHLAATVARPQDCCSGQMLCAKFLSTITLVRPAGSKHT